MSNVAFYLTYDQARALIAIRAGQGMPGPAGRFQTKTRTGLVRRGLIEADLRLTALGEAAAALVDKLVNPDA